MSQPHSDLRSRLEQCRAGDLSIEDLERWLYANAASVEEAVGKEFGSELLAFDFRGRFATHELRELIDRIYAALYPGERPIDQARRVAAEYLRGARDLHSTMRVLASIRFDVPEGWIPDEVIYLDSELDNIPAPAQKRWWLPSAWTQLMNREASVLAQYEQIARVVCAELLSKPAVSQ